MTRLCVPIFVKTMDQAKRDVALAAEAGADLVELRIDSLANSLKDHEVVQTIIRERMLPLIVTCRPISEGGRSELNTDDRGQLSMAAAEAGVEYFDIERAAFR